VIFVTATLGERALTVALDWPHLESPNPRRYGQSLAIRATPVPAGFLKDFAEIPRRRWWRYEIVTSPMSCLRLHQDQQNPGLSVLDESESLAI